MTVGVFDIRQRPGKNQGLITSRCLLYDVYDSKHNVQYQYFILDYSSLVLMLHFTDLNDRCDRLWVEYIPIKWNERTRQVKDGESWAEISSKLTAVDKCTSSNREQTQRVRQFSLIHRQKQFSEVFVVHSNIVLSFLGFLCKTQWDVWQKVWQIQVSEFLWSKTCRKNNLWGLFCFFT